MKITAKRFLALFLALTMMLSSFAFAEDPVQPETVPENTEQVIEQQPTENVVVDNTVPEVTEEQQVEPAAEVPQGETAEVEQQVEPAVEVPQEEPAADVPQEEPAADVPQEQPAADVPQEEPAADVPQEEPAADVPQEEPAADVPQEEPAADVPQEESAADVPQEQPAAEVPQEEPAADVPQEEPAADVPQEEPAADVPQEEPAADVPQEEPVTDVPQDEPATDVPQEEPAADVPQEEPAADVPQEEPAADVPLEQPAAEVPQEEPVTDAPQEEPADEVPQEAPATDMPQEEPAADVPQEEPAAEVPQEEPVTDVPQEEPTVESGEVQPEEPVTESTDDVVQVSVAKTLAIGDEWTGSITSGNELVARLEASAGKVHILAEGNGLYISVVKEEEEADGADNKQYADAEGKIDYSWNADNANYIIYVGMKDYQSGAFKLQVLSDQTYTALKEAEAAAQLAAEVNEKTEEEPAVPDEVIEQEEEPSTDIIEEELQETEPSAPVGEENEQEEVPVDTTDEKETEPSVPVSEEKGQEEVPVDATDEKETEPSVPVSEEKGQEEEPIDIHPRAAVSNETPAIGETITLTAVADVEIEEIAIWYTSPTGVEGSWERFAYGNEVYVKIDEGNSNNYFRFKLSDEIYSESVGIRATKSIQGGESKALRGTRGLVTYTISFDLNGGTGVEGAYSDQTIAQGNMAAKPADPTKDGSIFAGWYSSDDLFDFNKPVTSTCVLKAKWLRKVIVKFYTDQQETTEWNKKEIAEGEKVTAPDPAPTKTKYMLVGWNDSNGTAFDFDTPINEDLNLYAVWEEEIWSIGDISEGGSKNETGDVVTFTECKIRKGVSLDDTNDKDRYWADIKVVAPKSVTAENIDKVVISFDGTNWDHRSFARISQHENDNYTIILSLEIVAATLLKKASEHATIETSYWFAWESETEAAQKFTIAINPQNIELKDGDSRVLKIQDWKEVHTVTFSHDGTPAIDPVDVLDQKAVARPETDPAKEDYIFRAWQLDGEDYDFATPVTANITLTADWSDAAAKVGNVSYASLQDAIDAAHEMTGSVTVDLTADITEVAVIHQKAGLNLTLNGNGNTITGQLYIDGDARYDGADTLTIQNTKYVYDSSTYDDAFIDIPSTTNSGRPYTTGKHNYAHNVTIKNCSFSGAGTTTVAVRVASNAGAHNLVLNTLKVTNGHSLAQLVGVKDLTITGCEAIGVHNGINISGGEGTGTITGNVISADGYTVRLKDASGMAVNLSENTFSGAEGIISKATGEGKITIVDGKYTGELPTDSTKLTLQGGLFSVKPSVAVCAEGYYPIANKDEDTKGSYPFTVAEAAASVTAGEEADYYLTLEEAVAVSAAGDTVTLLRNASGAGIFVADGDNKNITIDLGGHEYTCTGPSVGSAGTATQAFHLEKNNTITIKNGKITSTTDSGVLMLIQNYSNLTLNGVELDGTKLPGGKRYVLSNNNGAVVINDTKITAKEGDIAFDVCRYANYPSVSVKVTGDSTINGDIEIDAGSGDVKEGLSLQIESGTVTGEIKLTAGAEEAISGENKPQINKASSVTIPVPDGYAWTTADVNSIQTIAKATARIDDKFYASLKDAVAAVTDSTATTITMIDNEAINVVGSAITIAAGRNVVLDLNGHEVVGTASQGSTSALITNKGILTIRDSSAEKTGKLISGATETWIYGGDGNYAGSYASNTITNSGTLTVESGYIENLSTGSATYAIDNNSSSADAIASIKGGTVKAHSVAIRQFANSATKENTVNVSGGTVEAGNTGIWIQLPGSDASKAMKAALNVTGGTLKGGSYAFYDYSYGNSFDSTQYKLSGGTFDGTIFSYGANIAISDGTYLGDVAIKQAKPSEVSVTGGRFSGDVYTYGDNASEGFITGGTFATITYEDEGETYDDDWPNLLDDDYIYDEIDGFYVVRPAKFVASVTASGKTKKYESLEEAFAAAEDGAAITLLGNCSGNGIVVSQGKYTEGLTVNFAGYTYTVDGSTVGSTGTETNGFQLLKDNKITFKNGTIASTKAKILVQNYSDLTLDGMTLTLNNTSYRSAYTLSNNNGSIVIDGSTINANPAGGYAFDVCRYSSYPSVHVTVAGGSTINGKVEVSASGSDAKDGFGLTLTSGTLTGDIVMDDTAKAALETAPDKVSITKATSFNHAAPEGYVWVDAEEGTQTIAKAVATIGETSYASLEAAFAAAKDGDTITLLEDCSGNGIKAPQGKFATGLTVDFNGHTYTVDGSTVGSAGTETNGFQLLKDNKITFKNGTIASTKAKILVQNYSDLTLEKMTLTLNNTSYRSAYTLSNNNGSIVIDGSTINANPEGGYAFDVCRYSSYPSVKVEVRGSSTINGDVEIYASGSDAKDGFGLKLTSGSISGEIVMDATAKAALEATPEKVSITKATSFDHAAPEGYVWVNAAAESEQTIQEAGAKIIAGNKTTYYAGLKEALAAAEDGDTIVLLKDSELSSYAEARKNVVLDLNGKTVTAAGGGIDLFGQMTVTDSSEDETGKLTAGSWGIWTNAGAELTVVKGTIEAGKWAIVAQGEGAKVTVSGGKVHSENGNAISGIGNSSDSGYTISITGGEIVSDNDVAIYHPNGTTLSISGGTIQGATAIYQKAGTLEISSNPVIKATGAKADYVFNGNGANATGDAIVVESCNYPAGVPTTNISGGAFSSENGSQVAAYAGNGVTEIPEVHAQSNALTVPIGEMWTGEAGHYTLAFAEAYVDDTPYGTLTEAISKTEENNKLYLVKNHTKVELIGEYEKVLDKEIVKLVDAVYVDGETKAVSFEIVKKLSGLTYEVTFQAVGNDTAQKSAIIATSGEGKQIKPDTKFVFDLDVPEALADETEVMVVHKQGETVIKYYLSLAVTEGKVSFDDVEHFSEFEFSADAVASITAGEETKYYTTLAEAVEAAAAGETVKLLKDTEIESIVVDKKITLDLDGREISSRTPALFEITAAGDLTITGNGKITGPAQGLTFDGKALIDVAGGKLTIEDGTLTATGSRSDGMYGVYVSNSGTAVFGKEDGTGPSITAHFAAIGTNNTTAPATITVNGGTYTANAVPGDSDWWSYFCAPVYAAANGTYRLNGGTFNGYYGISSRYADTDQDIALGSVTLNGTSGIEVFVDSKTGSTNTPDRVITSTVNTRTLPAGYAWLKTGENEYVVAEAAASITKDGKTTDYVSLADAVEAAAGGDTVKLLKDTKIESILVDKRITLDLNEKEITSDKPALFEVTGGLTITGNGKITGPENGAAYDGKALIDVNGGKLILEDGTLTATGSGSDGMYGIYVLNGGEAVFGKEGGTGPSITAHFAAIGTNNTTAPAKITVNGGAYTANAVPGDSDWWSYFCAPIYAAAAGDFTINGGTFSGYHGISSRYANVQQNIVLSGDAVLKANGGKQVFVDEQNGQGSTEKGRKVRSLSAENNLETIPEGYKWIESTDGQDGYILNKVWTVTFELVDGTYPEESEITAEEGKVVVEDVPDFSKFSEVKLNEDPVREHYTFDGWLLENEKAAADYEITKDTTFYVSWIGEEVIILVSDGMGHELNRAVRPYGTTMTAAEFAELIAATAGLDDEKIAALLGAKEGYTLDEEKLWTPELPTADVTIERTMVYNLNWIKVHTVTFDADGTLTEQKVNDGETPEEPEDPKEKTGYTFDGWYDGLNKYDFVKPITSDLVLKAKWTVNQYEVIYEGIEDATLTGGTEAGAYDFGTEIILPAASKPGAVFLGWKHGDAAETYAAGYAFELPAENQTYTAQWGEAEAEIGETAYATLEEAAAAVQDGETIRILKDVELEVNYPEISSVGQKVTLDLNGKNISGASLDVYGDLTITGDGTITGLKHGIWVNEGAKLTVESGTITNIGEGYAVIANPGEVVINGGIVKNGDNGSGAVYVNDGKLTVTGGTVESSKDDTTAIDLEGSTEAVISGGRITGHDWGVTVFDQVQLTVSGDAEISTSEEEGYGISANGNAGNNATINIEGGTITGTELGIYQPSGTLNISGGTITGATAVYNKSGTLNITGGTLNGTGAAAAYNHNGNGANATGDAVIVENCNYPNGAPTVTITGGSISSANGKQIAGYYTEEVGELATVTSNGAGLTTPETELWLKQEDGSYKLVEAVTVTFDAGDGEPEPEAQKIAKGTMASEPEEEPAKDGYVFEGWYLGEAETAFDFENTAITENTMLTAKWAEAVAKIGDKLYATFAEAAEARENDETVITLLANIAEPYTLEPGETLKVEKAGKSINVKPSEGPYVVKSATADGVTTYTIADAEVEYTNANGQVSYKAWSSTVISGNGTYKLLTDVTSNLRIAPTILASDVTLDLNGHMFTSTASDYAILLGRNGSAGSRKSFTITGEGTIVVNPAARAAIQAQGKYNDITIGEGVTIDGGCIALVSENQNLTVKGTINGGNDFAIACNGSSTKNAKITIEDATLNSNETAVYLPGDAQVNITNANITGATAVYVKSGNVAITGSTLNGTGADAGYTYNGSGANATGDALVVDNCGYPGGAPEVTVNGTVFNSSNAKGIGSYAKDDLELAKVTAETDAITIPKDEMWIENDQNGYDLVKAVFVTFDAEDGELEPEEQKIAKGAKAEKPEDPTKEGYIFDGWFLGEAETAFDFAAEITEDTELTAKWTAIEYKVIFNANNDDATGTMDDQTVAYDEETKLNPNAYAVENYSFAGWATEAEGAVAYGNGENIKNLAAEQDEEVNLYAVWTQNDNIEISYSSNGSMQDDVVQQTVYLNVATKLYDETSSGFSRDGYILTRWNTKANGNGTTYELGQEVTLTEKVNIKLYAQWVEAVAEVNGTTYATLAEALDAATAGDTVTVLKDIDLQDQAVITKSLTLDLNGKTINHTGEDIWNGSDWSLISVQGSEVAVTVTGAGTLQAKENDTFAMDIRDGAKLTIENGNYIGNVHAIYVYEGELTVNGGTYRVQQTYSATQPYDFTLNCYDTSYTNGTAKITVNGGTFYKFDPQNCSAEPGGPVDETGEGYVAIDQGNGSYKVVEGYIVTFDPSYTETSEDEWTVRVAKDETVEKPEEPSMPDYVFDGWYLFAEGEEEHELYDFAAPVIANILIYAKWTEAVAQINRDGEISYYTSIQDALDDANYHDTVELLKDTAESITLEGFRPVNLNLGGHMLTVNSSTGIDVSNGASLDIFNGKLTSEKDDFIYAHNGGSIALYGGDEEETLKVVGTSSLIWANQSGTVYIGEGAELSSTSTDYVAVFADNDSNITLDGGSIVADGNNAICAKNGATINVNKGTVKSNSIYPAGYAAYNGFISINGGKVESEGKYALVAAADGIIEILDGELNKGVLAHENGNAHVWVHGGKIGGSVVSEDGADAVAFSDRMPVFKEYVKPENVQEGWLCTTAAGEDGYYHLVQAMLVHFMPDNGDPDVEILVPQGEKIPSDAIPENPAKEGYAFTGWMKEAEGGFAAFNPAEEQITENLIVHAGWLSKDWELDLWRLNVTTDESGNDNYPGYIQVETDENGKQIGGLFKEMTLIKQESDEEAGKPEGYVIGTRIYVPEAVGEENLDNLMLQIDGGEASKPEYRKDDVSGRYYTDAWKTVTVDEVYDFLTERQAKIDAQNWDDVQNEIIWTYAFTLTDEANTLNIDQTFTMKLDLRDMTMMLQKDNSGEGDPQIAVNNWQILDMNRYFNVKFDPDDGTIEDTDLLNQNVRYASTPEYFDNPEKAGYQFMGWYITDGDELTEQYNFEPVYGELKLKAVWEANEMQVNIQLDGGKIIDDEGEETEGYSIPVRYGEKISKPTIDPTKDGFAFMGWYVWNQETEEEEVYNFESTVTDNFDLNARWASTAWDLDPWQWTPGGMQVYGGEENDQKLTGAEFNYLNIQKSAGDDSIGRPEGYAWVGVQFIAPEAVTDANINRAKYRVGEGEWASFEKDGQLEDGRFWMGGWMGLNETKIEELLNADIHEKTWTWEFDWDGDAADTQTFEIKVNLDNISLNDEDGNLIFQTIEGVITEYVVRFAYNDGVTSTLKIKVRPHSTISDSDMPEDPTMEGYTFEGWFIGEGEDEEYHEVEYDFDQPIDGEVYLSAHWTINTYNVSFVDGDGNTLCDKQEVEFNNNASFVEPDPVEGKTFQGWFFQNGDAEAEFDFNTSITKDTVLTGKWTDTIYHVTFHNVNGRKAMQPVLHGSTVDVQYIPTVKVSGNVCDYWFYLETVDEEEEEIEVKFDLDTKVYRDYDLYPHLAEAMKVSFVDEDGNNLHDPVTVAQGTKASEIKPDDSGLVKEYYEFDGWYVEDNTGKLVKYEFSDDNTVETDLVLIGKWADTITFVTTLNMADYTGIYVYIHIPEGEDPAEYTVQSNYQSKYKTQNRESRIDSLDTATRARGDENLLFYQYDALRAASPEMTDVVTVSLLKNGSVLKTESYSVRSIAEERLQSGELDAIRTTLHRALLQYGHYAQLRFGNNTDDLPDITGAPALVQIPDSYAASGDPTDFGAYISKFEAKIDMDSAISMNIYLTPATGYGLEDFEISITDKNGKNYTKFTAPEMSGGRIYIKVQGIAAPQLGNNFKINVKLKNDSSKKATWTRSLITCAYENYQGANGNTNRMNLMMALYQYYLAAAARWPNQ